jgi:hypothetical protein
MRDYREDIKVDKYDLDRGLEMQPEVASYWGTKWAKSVSKVKKLDTQIKIKRAEIAKKLRYENPGLRVTDSMIENECFTNEGYLMLHNAHIGATEDMNVLEVAYNKFYDRRSSLSDLKDLWSREYYSIVPSEIMEDRDKDRVKLDEIEQLDHNERLQRIHGSG